MSGKLYAAAAVVDITPPVGTDLHGFPREELSCGVLERLQAGVLFLRNGDEQLVLITADLIGIPPALTRSVRTALRRNLGVSPSSVMLAATHTHCGPVILPGMIWLLKPPDKKYLEELKDKLLAAVLSAQRRLAPARLGAGTGACRFNINRRVRTRDGMVMAPNRRGVCDHEVGVLRVDDERGDVKTLVVNFTCHPTVTGGLLISPDYPGFMRKHLVKRYRRKPGVLFVTGACGNIRPCVLDSAGEFRTGTTEDLERLGSDLAAEVFRVAASIKTCPNIALRGASAPVRLPLARPSARRLEREIDEYERNLKILAAENKPRLHSLIEEWKLRRTRRLHAFAKSGRNIVSIPAEIQLFAIGDIRLVGLPGEVFCEIGLHAKKLLGPARTFVVGYANSCPGYIPTAAALDEGGYEPAESYKGYGLPAPYAPAVEKTILDGVRKAAGI